MHAASHREHYDREYPHQVLALAETLRGKVLDRVIDFHMNLGIPAKSRSTRKLDTWYNYCFADPDHAKLFKVMFGGENSPVQLEK